jgi:acetoacetate decarboxylase
MPLVRTPEEVAAIEAVLANPRFVEAQTLTVEFLTSEEAVRRVLPPGLEPVQEPLVLATVGRWGSNCVGDFAGGAIYVAARFGDLTGAYTLAMYMDTDAALIFGRDVFGEPKKLGRSRLERSGSHMRGWVERMGVRLIEVEGDLTTELGPAELERARFNVKAVPSANGHGLEDDAVLTVAEFKLSLSTVVEGAGEVTLRGTVHDPLDELEVLEIRRATYVEGDMDTRCRSLARIPAAQFVGHAYGRLDYWPALSTERDATAPS